MKPLLVVAAIALIDTDNRVLIAQRPQGKSMAGLWEFPGGKVEAGETDAEALRREFSHRLGAQIECGKLISFVTHPYEHYAVDLFLYECRIASGKLAPMHVHDFKWVTSAEFEQYPFTPADEASMNKLLGE